MDGMVIPMATALTVKVDPKCRAMIPQRLRRSLGIEPGDMLFVETDEERRVLRFAKAEYPIDDLIEHALKERRAGRTRSLRSFASEHDIALDAG